MWWGTPQETPLKVDQGAPGSTGQSAPSSGASKPPTEADVNMMEPQTAHDSPLAEGIRGLFARSELCDVVLVAGEKKFPVHKAMLAAMSSNFGSYLRHQTSGGQGDDPMQGMLSPIVASPPASEAPALEPAATPTAPAEGQTEAGATAPDAAGEKAPAEPAGTEAPAQEAAATESPPAASGSEVPAPLPELQVVGIESTEALDIVLSYVYTVGTGAPWEYKPTTAEANKDILRLARHFGMPHLHEHAARWLTRGLTTANVVDRLVTCEELNLGLLREKIMEQLTKNPSELSVVSSSPEIMKHPRILQDLLVLFASLRGMGPPVQAKPEVKAEPEVQAEPKAEEKQPEEPKVEKPAEKPTKKAEIHAAEKRVADKPPAKRAKKAGGA